MGWQWPTASLVLGAVACGDHRPALGQLVAMQLPLQQEPRSTVENALVTLRSLVNEKDTDIPVTICAG